MRLRIIIINLNSLKRPINNSYKLPRMNKLFLLLLFQLVAVGQEHKKAKGAESNTYSEFSKLPNTQFVFIKKNKLIEKSIVKDRVVSRELAHNAFETNYHPAESSFNNVKKIAALSDIHGQYDLFVELLINNKIIDVDLNWNFGEGHLVIVGDIFDRGDKVNQILWLVYKLEIQAKNKGGHLHFLLGNHEYMVLQKDLRYIHKKEKLAAQLLDLDYDALYNNKTVLGRWLRSKSTIIRINDIIFTHGGVSEEFIMNNGVDLNKINALMREQIDTPKKRMKAAPESYGLYYGPKSLIWYRGYFKEYYEYYQDHLTEGKIDNILNLLNSNQIVIGHTSNDEVVQLYNNKIFCVDSSMKKGKYGEILFIENKQFFKGKLDGTTSKIIPLAE